MSNSRVGSFWLSLKDFASRALRKIVFIEPEDRLKVLLLASTFFLIIGAYTLIRETKDSLFIHIVGKEYIPIAKLFSPLVLIPAILVYSRLVDILKKQYLLYFYTLIYGVVGLLIAYYLAHPTIGLANTATDKSRVFGWLIYFFIEGYTAFVVGVFWAFVNSITSPNVVKNNYPVIIAGSKLGGACACLFGMYITRREIVDNLQAYSDITNHQILIGAGSFFLILIPILITVFLKLVPKQTLHGYEAAYELEQEKKAQAQAKKQNYFVRLFSGLRVLLRYPYALGIFGTMFFFEVVYVVFCYERLGVGKDLSLNISDLTYFLYKSMFWMHFVGLVIVLMGTRILISTFGERKTLMLIPMVTGLLIMYYMVTKSAFAIMTVFVSIRAINYAFAQSLRESLYIPTSKDIRFKAKSWIDAFGVKIAKGFGSNYVLFAQTLSPALAQGTNTIFFAGVVGLWIITASLVGRRYERAVKNNEVIGA